MNEWDDRIKNEQHLLILHSITTVAHSDAINQTLNSKIFLNVLAPFSFPVWVMPKQHVLPSPSKSCLLYDYNSCGMCVLVKNLL